MKTVNFNTGYKEYCFNGDESRKVSINICDINIVERLRAVSEKMRELDKNFSGKEKTVEAFTEADKYIRECLDEAFNAPISRAAFGNTNCLSPVGGKTLFESFIEAFAPVIEEDIKNAVNSGNISAAHSNDKIEKYIRPVIAADPKMPAPIAPTSETSEISKLISKMSAEEKRELIRQLFA